MKFSYVVPKNESWNRYTFMYIEDLITQVRKYTEYKLHIVFDYELDLHIKWLDKMPICITDGDMSQEFNKYITPDDVNHSVLSVCHIISDVVNMLHGYKSRFFDWEIGLPKEY